MLKDNMNVFYDTEFLERPYAAIAPISIGMVREDGKEYYAEYADMPTLEIARHDWLMANVMTSIPHIEVTNYINGFGTPVKDLELVGPYLRHPWEIRKEIIEFVSDITPVWWAWYGAYDHVVLSQTFGRMIDLPDGFPMMTMDLKQLVKAAGNPQMPQQPAGHHNALADARFNVVRYNFLKERLDVRKSLGVQGPAY